MYIHPTIQEQIDASKELTFTHRTMNDRLFIEDKKSGEIVKVPFNALYMKFKDFFDSVSTIVPLTEEERNRYRFQPKRLSLDNYGTTKYWSLLLYLNECPSILDFDLDIVRVVYNDKIDSFLTELNILSKK